MKKLVLLLLSLYSVIAFAEEPVPKPHLGFGFGYTSTYTPDGISHQYNGLNFDLGLRVPLSKKLFLQLRPGFSSGYKRYNFDNDMSIRYRVKTASIPVTIIYSLFTNYKVNLEVYGGYEYARPELFIDEFNFGEYVDSSKVPEELFPSSAHGVVLGISSSIVKSKLPLTFSVEYTHFFNAQEKLSRLNVGIHYWIF